LREEKVPDAGAFGVLKLLEGIRGEVERAKRE
jgi:hypothetical protein